MAQYTLRGMLSKPLLWPRSMTYMIEPSMMTRFMTAKKKTSILRRDWIIAATSTFASRTYNASLRTRKIRRTRSRRITPSAPLPVMNMPRYVGIIASRSIIPKKLAVYFAGLGEHDTLSRYSMVNMIVNSHSSVFNIVPWVAFIEATLSSITTATLKMIAMMSTRSNSLPAGVSVPKMMVFSFWRMVFDF